MPSPASSAVVPGGTTGAYSVSDAFNQSQQYNTSSSGSHSGPDIYTATLENSDYNNALDFHSGNYQNILAGYNAAFGNADSQANRIGAGYSTLNTGVQNTIGGIEASQRRAIADTYAQQAGATTASTVGRGLGNSTVLDSLQRGNLYDKEKADIALSNQMAQLKAGYQGQFGSAGLAALSAGAGQEATLGGQYMSILGGQQNPRMVYAPNVTQSQSNTAGGGTSVGSSHGGSTSQTVPSVVQIPGVGPGGPTGTITANPPPANPFAGNSYTPYNPFGGVFLSGQNPYLAGPVAGTPGAIPPANGGNPFHF